MATRRFPSWQMQDGHRIPIAEMTDHELIDTIHRLHEQAEAQASRAAIELPYPSFQGEMAQNYAEQELEGSIADSV